MSNAAYFNVRGEPLSLSARDAVLAREPLAYAVTRRVIRYGRKRAVTEWEIRKTRADGRRRSMDRLLGDGATEESAWRNTLSRMRIEDNAAEAST